MGPEVSAAQYTGTGIMRARKPQNRLQIAIVDYGMGNLESVAKAFSWLGFDTVITREAEQLERADALVLPGVGAFGEASENIAGAGLVPVLNRLVVEGSKPILGICLGMQLFADEGVEGGTHPGLGWIPGRVVPIDAADGMRVPVVGWGNVTTSDEILFSGGEAEQCFYFDHSFQFVGSDEYVIARSDWGTPYCAAVRRGHIFGTQFHPEKSQVAGLRLLRNFTEFVIRFRRDDLAA